MVSSSVIGRTSDRQNDPTVLNPAISSQADSVMIHTLRQCCTTLTQSYDVQREQTDTKSGFVGAWSMPLPTASHSYNTCFLLLSSSMGMAGGLCHDATDVWITAQASKPSWAISGVHLHKVHVGLCKYLHKGLSACSRA